MKRLYKNVRLIDTDHIEFCIDICLGVMSLGAHIQVADGEVVMDMDLFVIGIYLGVIYKKRKGG